jgi:hypothetical protein
MKTISHTEESLRSLAFLLFNVPLLAIAASRLAVKKPGLTQFSPNFTLAST